MADYFVSSADGNNADNGTTLDLAWATLEYALESGGLSAGDFVWIRPNHSEIPLSNIEPIYDGTANSFINIIAWPKAAFAITSATWTNGSTTVDLVLPASLTRTGHVGRMVTAPDGNDYFITYITDSNTFIIDREYAGATVTLSNGASSIIADDYYTEAQAIDDSTWTIKKTDWNANNPARPVIDFNDGDFQLLLDVDVYFRFQGIEFKDSTDSQGIVRIYRSQSVIISNCLFKQSTQSDTCVTISTSGVLLDKSIFEGSGAGVAQRGIQLNGGAFLHLKNSALYNLGDTALLTVGTVFLENVNLGIEIANGDDEIMLERGGEVYGKGVRLGGSNGYITYDLPYFGRDRYSKVSLENYQKVLGDHRTFFPGGYFEKAAVSGETPNKKLSDNVIKITPNISGYEFISELAVCMLEHELEMTAAAHTLKYWIYNDSGVTLNDTAATDNIWLEAEYVIGYDDTSEYVQTKLLSTQIDILDAADADDWDYLEVTLTPAVASKVRLKIYFSKYLATTNVFIDPAVVIT